MKINRLIVLIITVSIVVIFIISIRQIRCK